MEDASRFTPNDVIFTITNDNFQDIMLYIRSITSTTASGNTTLMSTPEKAFIDSTVVDFWLLVSTFTSADQKTGGHTIDIVLPYASFDLNLSAPFVNTTMNFPLRQGQNDSIYTLGRAFKRLMLLRIIILVSLIYLSASLTQCQNRNSCHPVRHANSNFWRDRWRR